MNNQIEYKSFTIEDLQECKENASDPKYFYFSGYASVFSNIDLGNDIIQKGAFSETLKKFNDKKRLPLLWQHEMKKPIGIAEIIKEDDRGLYIVGKLPRKGFVDTDVLPQIELGSVREMSIGFYVKDFEIQKNIRIIKAIDLFEASLVTIAMNPLATIDNFKSFSANINLPLTDRGSQWDSAKAEDRIRAYTNSTDKPSASYKKYFMYYDRENEEQFGAYKLLFADIIDGKPYIVPRAIFAIAGALQGARGGLDVPEQDKMKIKKEVEKIYNRMATEFEDENLVAPFTKFINNLESLADIEYILKDKGFSNTEAKTLISKVKEFSQRDVENVAMQRDVAVKSNQIQEILGLIKSINNKIN